MRLPRCQKLSEVLQQRNRQELLRSPSDTTSRRRVLNASENQSKYDERRIHTGRKGARLRAKHSVERAATAIILRTTSSPLPPWTPQPKTGHANCGKLEQQKARCSTISTSLHSPTTNSSASPKPKNKTKSTALKTSRAHVRAREESSLLWFESNLGGIGARRRAIRHAGPPAGNTMSPWICPQLPKVQPPRHSPCAALRLTAYLSPPE